MELIDIHMRLTPSQMFELSALVQKWQDHERDVEIKKTCPNTVLEGYKPNAPSIDELSNEEKDELFFVGVEAIRHDKLMNVVEFAEKQLHMSRQNWRYILKKKTSLRLGVYLRIARSLNTTFEALVERGWEVKYGKA